MEGGGGQSVLVVWHGDVLVVVAAVVGGEEQLGRLGAQARAQRLVAAQHRRQVLGLLRQLLHLLPQRRVLLLQVLALLQRGGGGGRGSKEVGGDIVIGARGGKPPAFGATFFSSLFHVVWVLTFVAFSGFFSVSRRVLAEPPSRSSPPRDVCAAVTFSNVTSIPSPRDAYLVKVEEL